MVSACIQRATTRGGVWENGGFWVKWLAAWWLRERREKRMEVIRCTQLYSKDLGTHARIFRM